MRETNQPLLSIIITTFNSLENLRVLLRSLTKISYKHTEIIVVDNASTDGTKSFIEVYYPEVKFIQSKKLIGITEANNIGIRNAKGAYIAFLNDDMEVSEEWPLALITLMETDKTIGVCAGTQMDYYERSKIKAWGFNIDRYGNTLAPGLFMTAGSPVEVFGVLTQDMVIRRTVLEQVGWFDQDFYAWEDELDLCWRVRLAGYKCVYVPGSYVYHKGGATIGEAWSPRNTYLIVRNKLTTLIKNLGTSNLISVLPGFIVTQLIIALYYTLAGHGKVASSIIRALLWNLFYLRLTLSKRRLIQTRIRRHADDVVLMNAIDYNTALRRMIHLCKGLYPLLHGLVVKLDLCKMPSMIVGAFDGSVATVISIYYGNCYEVFPINQGDVVIDVGAHVGAFTIKAAREAGPLGKVVSVEPGPRNFSFLLRNIQLNRMNNVIPVRTALGSADGHTRLWLSSSSDSHSTAIKRGWRSIDVLCTTLDRLATQLGLDKVDLVKINAEGAEFEILRGAKRILRNTERIMIDASHYLNEAIEVEEYLREEGFSTVLQRPSSSSIVLARFMKQIAADPVGVLKVMILFFIEGIIRGRPFPFSGVLSKIDRRFRINSGPSPCFVYAQKK